MTTTEREQSFKRGDVILVLYPNSDSRTAKTRHAIIVQSDSLQTGLSQVQLKLKQQHKIKPK
jgi:mRNA interferase MazF